MNSCRLRQCSAIYYLTSGPFKNISACKIYELPYNHVRYFICTFVILLDCLILIFGCLFETPCIYRKNSCGIVHIILNIFFFFSIMQKRKEKTMANVLKFAVFYFYYYNLILWHHSRLIRSLFVSTIIPNNFRFT